MPAMQMHHEIDPRDVLIQRLGSLSNFECFNNQVLLAVYQRPTDGKTKGGLHLPQQVTEEDRYQSKVGLLVAKGPEAFVSGNGWFMSTEFKINEDWLVFRPSDGWAITVNGVLCRMFDDISIRGRVNHCDDIW